MEHVVSSKNLRIALVGNPNCGKTALFNRLTGSRQKVANYPGVTVERKEGWLITPADKQVQVLDLPGAYSLDATSPDEAITRAVVLGQLVGEISPDILVCVTDATNLRLNLRFVLELKQLGLPMLLVLNMIDVAHRRGMRINLTRLEQELGMPVVETIAVRGGGEAALIAAIDATSAKSSGERAIQWQVPDLTELHRLQREVRRILAVAIEQEARPNLVAEKLDQLVLHPILGLLLLGTLLFLVFQAVFSWAVLPMSWIESAITGLGAQIQTHMSEGPLRSLLVDGVIAGVGSVLVFLPQILILFFFILFLEDSGYLPRAAFLLDRLMGSVGLSGRSFIPLLSSFACAIPGIMATRTIRNPRDRLITIMIAPLMTCSARLPVYALLIAAFIPQKKIGEIFNLQGLVLFSLYFAGILSAMAVAYVLRRIHSGQHYQPLMLELPAYRWPHLQNLAMGLYERAKIFLGRVGTIILALMILLWFLSSFPAPPEGAIGPAIQYSFAGYLGRALEYVFAPIGFNWQISIALIPGLAAREVAVGALGTVYALSATGDDLASALQPMLAATWSIPTALSLLAWYVFAPQCISTLMVVKRETNSWRYPLLMACYLFGLAYVASLITYHVARWVLGG